VVGGCHGSPIVHYNNIKTCCICQHV
jgi:hypothetical protein